MGMARRPLLETMTAFAPRHNSGEAESAEGAALQILPPMVALFLSCIDPIPEHAWARILYFSHTTGRVRSLLMGTAAPICKPSSGFQARTFSSGIFLTS